MNPQWKNIGTHPPVLDNGRLKTLIDTIIGNGRMIFENERNFEKATLGLDNFIEKYLSETSQALLKERPALYASLHRASWYRLRCFIHDETILITMETRQRSLYLLHLGRPLEKSVRYRRSIPIRDSGIYTVDIQDNLEPQQGCRCKRSVFITANLSEMTSEYQDQIKLFREQVHKMLTDSFRHEKHISHVELSEFGRRRFYRRIALVSEQGIWRHSEHLDSTYGTFEHIRNGLPPEGIDGNAACLMFAPKWQGENMQISLKKKNDKAQEPHDTYFNRLLLHLLYRYFIPHLSAWRQNLYRRFMLSLGKETALTQACIAYDPFTAQRRIQFRRIFPAYHKLIVAAVKNHPEETAAFFADRHCDMMPFMDGRNLLLTVYAAEALFARCKETDVLSYLNECFYKDHQNTSKNRPADGTEPDGLFRYVMENKIPPPFTHTHVRFIKRADKELNLGELYLLPYFRKEQLPANRHEHLYWSALIKAYGQTVIMDDNKVLRLFAFDFPANLKEDYRTHAKSIGLHASQIPKLERRNGRKKHAQSYGNRSNYLYRQDLKLDFSDMIRFFFREGETATFGETPPPTDYIRLPEQPAKISLQELIRNNTVWHLNTTRIVREIDNEIEKIFMQKAQCGNMPGLAGFIRTKTVAPVWEEPLQLDIVRAVQLTGQQALNNESKKMGHCVASYFSDVVQGYCLIFSFESGNDSSTIEFQPYFGDGGCFRIVQHESYHRDIPCEAHLNAGETLRKMLDERFKDEQAWLDFSEKTYADGRLYIQQIRKFKTPAAALNRAFDKISGMTIHRKIYRWNPPDNPLLPK